MTVYTEDDGTEIDEDTFSAFDPGSTFICAVGKIQCIKKNEGILAPKPLWRGIWRDFYALFLGDLVGFYLIVKQIPGGVPGVNPQESQ